MTSREDPAQTVLRLGCSRNVPTSCCSLDFGRASQRLVREALAEVLQEGSGADLKTSQHLAEL